ncbi:protein of unknown function DUF291 [Ruminiclostridium papyrosolvens DSM 2782]|uniref:SLH domain-containing protein n=1 Tax=Ruminiclostridium papyrosolvens DSM 2782 TaxID=588581 RepID=F1TDV7_9FIRM|nr:leucine-rich repeat protein [Ruminiclostridium papyrosolvens]EGD47403.1 protein of unknown function DUF291 [Ruminiclostridium papyrosolvens DSM 2782]WES34746.1 leucine-rich repeat protein [Ruminiclostridium papyrosolvens DSM 2782]
MKTLKTKLNRLFCIVMAVLLLLNVMPLGMLIAYAEDTQAVASGSCGTNVNWTLTAIGESSYALTISASDENNTMADYQVPTNADGVPWKSYITGITSLVVQEGVKNLGDRTCYGATSLTSVSIPSTVSDIGNGVFRGCTALTEASFGGAITMDKNVFYGCTSLKIVSIPEGTTILADNTFSGCNALEELTLPATLTSIGASAFKDCSNIKTINFSGNKEEYKTLLENNSATAIPLQSTAITVICSDGNYVYEEKEEPEKSTTGTTGDVSWSMDTETGKLILSGIGKTADYSSATDPANSAPWLDYMDQIQEVVVEEGITYLGKRLFYGADNLIKVTLPDSLTSLEEGVFRECTKLKEITIPANVTTIGRVQFYQCVALESLSILGNVTILKDKSLSGCTALKSLTLPASFVSIEKEALSNCNSLNSIHYGGTKQEYQTLVQSNSANTKALQSAMIDVICTDGTYVYGRISLGNGLEYSLSNGTLTIIGEGTMDDYTLASEVPWAGEADSIKIVVIKGGVAKIGANAFAEVNSIENVFYIGKEEGWNTLKAASGINNEKLFTALITYGLSGTCGEKVNWKLSEDETTLTISGQGTMYAYNTTTTLAPWLYSKDNITKVVINEGVTDVGDYAFYGCKLINSLTFPSSVEELGTYAFGGCISLEEVAFPEGLRVIGAKAFNACSGLTTVYIPKSLTNIDMKAFILNSSLSTVYYAGTENQLKKVLVSESASGNNNLLNAKFVFGSPLPSTDFSDVGSSDWYAGAVKYMVENEFMTGESGKFGSDNQIRSTEIVSLLYQLAGSPGMYSSAIDWALQNKIDIYETDDKVTVLRLMEIIYSAANYNGVDVTEVTGSNNLDGITNTGTLSQEELLKLTWVFEQGYFTDLISNKGSIDCNNYLTRSEGASVLAAYIKSGAAYADRYRKIVTEARAALEAKGDGIFYIFTPKIAVPNITAKAGDFTLLVLPDGQTMMIDSGVGDCNGPVMSFVRDIGLKSLDYFVLSHPHTDHVGNALSVAKYFYDEVGGTIGTYLYTGYKYSTLEPAFAAYLAEKNVNMRTDIKSGDYLKIGDVEINIFNPTEEDLKTTDVSDESLNNISMAMKFTYGNATYLTSGDLYVDKEAELVQKYGSKLKADIMKSNHHGLYTSNSSLWSKTVSPKVVITNNDDVGSSIIYRRLSREGSAYYSVGVDGLVMITMSSNADYTVTSQYDTILRQEYSGEIGKPTNRISPATAIFDKKAGAEQDIKVNMTLNGNTLSAITNGLTYLERDIDYSLSGNIVTIKKEFLDSQSVGSITLTLLFSAGNSSKLNIIIYDTTSTGNTSTIEPEQLQAPTIWVDANTGKAIVDVKPVLDNNTDIAKSELKSELLNSALKLAKVDQDGIKTVSINVQNLKDSKAYEVVLPSEVLIQNEMTQKLEIKTNKANIELPGNFLYNAGVLVQSDNVTITIKEVEKKILSDKTSTLVGDRPAIELSINANGKMISLSNSNAQIKVSIPYTPTEQELRNHEHIVAYYIDENENAITVPSGKYNTDSGEISFTTTKLERFSIGYVEKTFADIDSFAWAKKEIEALASKGIINGTSNATYSPSANITRADYLVLLIRSLSLTTEVDDNFDDVNPGNYYYEAIGIAKKLGITSGKGNNLFNPKESITRQEMFTLTTKALKLVGKLKDGHSTEVLENYKDQSTIATYALEDIAALVEEGIIKGAGSMLTPLKNASRAEAAVVLYKIYNR